MKSKLPAGKPYYLLAKDMVSAGKPKAGRLIGAYTGAGPVVNVLPRPVPVTGMAGDILNDINITLNELPDPPELKLKIRTKPLLNKQNISSVSR